MDALLKGKMQISILSPIGLGYHDDLKTRISFIEVLTSILKQGAEFNSLADTALVDRFNTMLDLVAMETDKQDFPVMMALINAVPPENLVSLRCPSPSPSPFSLPFSSPLLPPIPSLFPLLSLLLPSSLFPPPSPLPLLSLSSPSPLSLPSAS